MFLDFEHEHRKCVTSHHFDKPEKRLRWRCRLKFSKRLKSHARTFLNSQHVLPKRHSIKKTGTF